MRHDKLIEKRARSETGEMKIEIETIGGQTRRRRLFVDSVKCVRQIVANREIY